MTAMGDNQGKFARVVETHISVLVFYGDRVFKLRKPVRFGFLDFTERVLREADCRREVELNRRLAPDVYLGVADVVVNGEPVDHMVVMRALPEERRLATLAQARDPLDQWLDRVAAVLASFHASATRSAAISLSASSRALERNWEQNFEETQQYVGTILNPTVEAEVRALVPSWLHRHEDLLVRRIREGRICDGHGDLRADDVFCLDEGVRILDCIEFCDELRYGDVCADVAFLAMDLECLGRPEAARQFVRAYERDAGDAFPATLLHHYIAQRAYVRSKVACLRAEQGVEGAGRSARELQLLALRHLRRARLALILVGGLPGTGKSTLAAGLARETGWVLLRSDEVRHEIALGADRYAPEAVSAVYSEVLRRAKGRLASEESVIIDASWIDATERARASTVAQEAGAEFVEVCCSCEEAVAAGRIEARSTRGDDVSDATTAVRDTLARQVDPWPSAVVRDTSKSTPGEDVEWALRELAGR